MRDGVVRRRRVRLKRDDSVRGPVVKARDIEHNVKRAQRHTLQNHRLRGHGDLSGFEIDPHPREIKLESDEVLIDVAGGGRLRDCSLRQFCPRNLERPAELIEAIGELPTTRLAGVTPAALLRHRQKIRAAKIRSPGGDRRLRNLARW
jgi:hypothetical protein